MSSWVGRLLHRHAAQRTAHHDAEIGNSRPRLSSTLSSTALLPSVALQTRRGDDPGPPPSRPARRCPRRTRTGGRAAPRPPAPTTATRSTTAQPQRRPLRTTATTTKAVTTRATAATDRSPQSGYTESVTATQPACGGLAGQPACSAASASGPRFKAALTDRVATLLPADLQHPHPTPAPAQRHDRSQARPVPAPSPRLCGWSAKPSFSRHSAPESATPQPRHTATSTTFGDRPCCRSKSARGSSC